MDKLLEEIEEAVKIIKELKCNYESYYEISDRNKKMVDDFLDTHK